VAGRCGEGSGKLNHGIRLLKFTTDQKMNALFILESNGSGLSGKTPAVNSFGGRFYKGLNYLKQHCFEPIGVNDLAKTLKISKRALHKTFLKNMGQSPGRELRRMRIERAKDLLLNSNHSQKVISRMSGYRNMNSFWVSFRKIVGESPGKFRSRFRNIITGDQNELQRYIQGNGTAAIVLLSNAVDSKWFQQLVQDGGANQPPNSVQLNVFEGRIAFKGLSKKADILKGSILVNPLPVRKDTQVPPIFGQNGKRTR
jgi:AraC-like DNA-binding protein